LLRYRRQQYALILIGLIYLCLQLLSWIPAIDTVDGYQTAQQLLKTFCYSVFILLVSQYCQHYQAMRWLLSKLKTTKKEFDLRTMLIDLLSTLFSRKLILRLVIVIMVIGLILSRSRMGNAGFFTALGVVSVLAMFIYRRPPRLFKPLVVSIFILELLIVGSIFGVDKVKQRLKYTSFSAETRNKVVIDSLPIIQDNLFTGTGGGSFYSVFPQYQPQFYSGFYDHAHNEYVQFAVEYGVVLTAIIGLWVLYAFWLACRTMYLRNNKCIRVSPLAAR
jgi:O-antigen ligase